MGQREVGKVGNWHSLPSVPLCPLSPHQHCTDSPFLSPALLCCPACPACAPERSPSRVSGALGMWGHWGGEWWGEAWRLCWVGVLCYSCGMDRLLCSGAAAPRDGPVGTEQVGLGWKGGNVEALLGRDGLVGGGTGLAASPHTSCRLLRACRHLLQRALPTRRWG